ncbi:MAG: hypothetical protein HY675_21035 [Chloroflexi bacterium]|nr:hypothetical protein [Chloroflexota bacterium]
MTRRIFLTAFVSGLTTIFLSAWGMWSSEPDQPVLDERVAMEFSDEIVLNPGWGLMNYPWENPRAEAQPFISGRAGGTFWKDLEPSEGIFNWPVVEKFLANLPPGRKAWLRLDASIRANESLTPEWVFQAGARWVPHVSNGRVRVPVYWDPVFKAKWETTIATVAARYDGDTRLAGVEINGQGHYGEMVPEWERIFNRDKQTWVDVGYSDQLWIEHQKWAIDMFLRYFKKTPVAIQVVNDRALWGASPARPVLDYAVQTYGMRVYAKWSGLAPRMIEDTDKMLASYFRDTEIILEEARPFEGPPNEFGMMAYNVEAARASTVFVYDGTFRWARSSDVLQVELERLARRIAPQISIVEARMPGSVRAGEAFDLWLRWANQSNMPLRGAQRIGEKDVPVSAVAFVDLVGADGFTVGHYQYEPSTPTTEWYANSIVEDWLSLAVPLDLAAGLYDVRVGIQNPRPYAEGSPLRLLNTKRNDGSDRYQIGQIRVLPGY